MIIVENVLEQHKPCGVTSLARQLGVPRARIHRHVANLRQSGFLAQGPVSRGYVPGWRLLLLGQHISHTTGLVNLARPPHRLVRLGSQWPPRCFYQDLPGYI
ncbi:helix-turn-helix domain-containing protein [Tomitella gaofuii]|uniref:helix-turn-helix domain-containing protein n=1 Tax=Tomitella gaofuii TaxID=2760083 RepID=UPI0015FCC731|nr:helix-turn-helix domain-containing protein [Tomitella gaofuii]